MIRLGGLSNGYMPADSLDFEYSIDSIDIQTVSAIEASVVWFTEGKGNEDLGVHFFQRLTGEAITSRDWQKPNQLQTLLPDAPLSYEGRLIKIRWCVRVRVYLQDGTELVAQHPFYLGTVTQDI